MAFDPNIIKAPSWLKNIMPGGLNAGSIIKMFFVNKEMMVACIGVILVFAYLIMHFKNSPKIWHSE